MAKKKPEKSEGSQVNADSGSTSVGSLNVGGNIENSVVIIGNNNVVHYHAIVEKNIEKHEPDYWELKHPYPMPPNFTGRIEERAILTHWLKEDTENRLFILRALGGFGKSALSWHWLTHDVDIKEYPKVLWWSFYEGDASFEHFIEETLKYLNLEVPQGGRPQVDALLKAMLGQKILLIMDGFERALRAYSSMNAAYQGDDAPAAVLGGGDAAESNNQLDCVNINAEIFIKNLCSLPNIKSKVLMTTRLTPRAVKPRGELVLGCREVELTSMQPADAVEFFHRQKIKGTHAEIEAACAPYGYHPLSLRLLAGRILKDFENPADIAVAQRLKIDGDIVQQKHHVLEVSYNSLPEHEQKLLSTIACFRSPVEIKTLEAITKNKKTLNDDLHDLVERGLLHFDDKKFDLHPIVRRYAYERLTAADRILAHEQLISYFDAFPEPEKIEKLEDLTYVIELYHHTVRAGNLDEAKKIFKERLDTPTYYQFGAYQLQIELLYSLFTDGENKPPRLKSEVDQALILNDLANACTLNGQLYSALNLGKIVNDIYENKVKNKKFLAVGLGNLAQRQLVIGALSAAGHSLYREIDLCKETEDKFWEADGHNSLGVLNSIMGNAEIADEEFIRSISLFEEVKGNMAFSTVWANRGKANLNASNISLAFENISQSLALANEWATTQYPMRRDYVRTYWLLGAVYRAKAELTLAEENLFNAINICRQINNVDTEANILLDLARLRYDQKDYKEAKSLAEEALLITERCGYVLQGADVNLFLAQYALEQEKDVGKAKEYAEEAEKLATCDGPPYYYKVAYEEAERMLASLNV